MNTTESKSRCPNAADGVHVIARSSVHAMSEPDDYGFFVDVCCENCQLCGTVRVEREQLEWDDA